MAKRDKLGDRRHFLPKANAAKRVHRKDKAPKAPHEMTVGLGSRWGWLSTSQEARLMERGLSVPRKPRAFEGFYDHQETGARQKPKRYKIRSAH